MPNPATTVSETSAELVELGYVSGAFGIKGWVKVKVYSDPQNSILFSLKECYLLFSNRIFQHRIQSVQVHGDCLLIQFQGMHDRTQAQQLQGMTIAVPRTAFPSPEEDEFYWVDLLGCAVYYQDAQTGHHTVPPVLIGHVRDVSDNGVHAILHIGRQITLDNGQIDWEKNTRGRYLEQLIPFVKERTPMVNLQEKIIITDIPSEF